VFTLTACSSPGEEYITNAAVASTMVAPMSIETQVVVLCEHEGVWTEDTVSDLLDHVSIQTGIHFNLTGLSFFSEREFIKYCGLEQYVLISVLDFLRQQGVFVIVMTSERRNMSLGFTTVEYALRPLIMMRAGLNTTETVSILLHELGHQMNLRHSPTDSQSLTTDDYLLSQVGRDYFLNYVEELSLVNRVESQLLRKD
jgi:hypothetical protein